MVMFKGVGEVRFRRWSAAEEPAAPAPEKGRLGEGLAGDAEEVGTFTDNGYPFGAGRERILKGLLRGAKGGCGREEREEKKEGDEKGKRRGSDVECHRVYGSDKGWIRGDREWQVIVELGLKLVRVTRLTSSRGGRAAGKAPTLTHGLT
jgi:hypothetical protein